MFKTKFANLLCGGTDKDDARLFAGVGKRQTLGEKTVTRPDSLRAAFARRLDNAVDFQVAVARLLAAQRQRNIGQLDVLGVFIGVGVNRYAGDPQTFQGADSTAGDFATVSNQDGVKHGDSPCGQSSGASP